MPPTPTSEIRVRVLLRPDNDTEQYWPCPAGVTFQLKKPRSTAKPLTTGPDGVTEPTVLPGGTYEVKINDDRFTHWQADDLELAEAVLAEAETESGVKVAAEAELWDLVLTPQTGLRPVLLRLSTSDGQAVSGGTVDIAAAGAPLM